MKAWLFGFAVLLASACGASSEARVADPLPRTASGWMELTPRPVHIEGREIDPTCSEAPGTDPAFRFWARRGTIEKLVIYFDGGGACWNDFTCALPRVARDARDDDGFYKGELIPADNPNALGGIFDFANPRNPLRDWSFVFIPYCTGDVHSGSNSAHYTNPDTGESFTIEHRGADNFRAVLQWVRENFNAPEEILVTGASAGAYGAATHYGRIREAFPNGRAMFLGDAGQGVTTPAFLTLRTSNWKYDLPANVFGAQADLTGDEDIVAQLAAHYPLDRFAQYTTANDVTQASFYALMGAENACRNWTQKMQRELTARERTPNFRAYLASGQSHTILRSPLFYTQRSGGAPFVEWVAALVGDGTGWDNRACENCRAPPRRCPF